ncbi:hypothetical protein [Paenibacillus sp. FSL W7-1287]|uniref:hypothetical protein n=1 Tax=Paenibacillus sp. FSL W7-1287 TaxID=2954538 RepID=UPI0030FC8553
MSKRATALSFFALAVVLFIGRKFIHHISAAIFGASNGNMSTGQYQMALDLTSTYSQIPEIVALAFGIIFFLWSLAKKE